MFAILGAAGKIGYSTAKALRDAGVPVRAILRNTSKAERLKAIGCDIACADLQDSAALAQAIGDADAVQIILPPMPDVPDMAADMRLSIESMAQALETAGPPRVLAISDYGAHLGDGVGITTLFHELEKRLRLLDTRRIFLRSAEHMEGWGRTVPVAIATGILPSLHDPVDKQFPTVSAPDVGVIAADLLLRPDIDAAERIVHAEGPRRYSTSDVADALGELLGRTIVARAVPRPQWRDSLRRAMSESAASLLEELYDAHNGGLIDAEPEAGEIRRGGTELIDALRRFVPAR